VIIDMKYLTIVRHAKSSRDNPEWDDLERPLNDRGKKAIQKMGKFLKKKSLHPDLLISSPAQRAKETAIGIGKLLDYPLENMEINKEIYFGNIQEIIGVISNINNNFNDVFLFGHEPLLSSMIHRLTGEIVEKFPTCSIYRIVWDIKKWSLISSQKGKCEFFVYPKLLQNE
jgi:phosphohistidine phosphatase